MIDRVWYISGPMAGYPENNFPAFAAAEKALTGLGIKVLSPHTIDHGNATEWVDFLRKDIEIMVQECNGLVLIRGWAQSRGSARMELPVAIGLEWPILYWDGYILHDMNKAGFQ